MNLQPLACAVGVTLVVLVLPARASDRGTIYDTLVAGNRHAVLLVAAKEAGETAKLRGTEQYTLFAPPDAAFKALDDATILAIATDPKMVQRLVNTHLVVGKYTAADLRQLSGKELRTVHGAALKVEVTKDGLRVGGAKVVSADMKCSNGVVHVIDAVLPVPKE